MVSRGGWDWSVWWKWRARARLTQRLASRVVFAGGEEALVVGGGLGVVAGPGEADGVEGLVEVAVAAAVEAVAVVSAA